MLNQGPSSRDTDADSAADDSNTPESACRLSYFLAEMAIMGDRNGAVDLVSEIWLLWDNSAILATHQATLARVAHGLLFKASHSAEGHPFLFLLNP